jgi:hypothetical protein
MPVPMQRLHKGQVYHLIDEEPHICRDGRETLLGIWESHCADCGQSFLFRVPLRAKHFWPNRRCRRCKRPGVRAGEVRA